MRMLLLLVLIFYSSASKVKRDVNDLKNDPVLSAVFSSDVQEKRNDRSISPLDESFGKNYNNKDDQKRDIGAEFQNNFPFEREGLVRDGLSSSITPFFPQSDSPDARLYNSQPMISNPISLPPSEVSDIRTDAISSEEKYAVNPALFAANYLPLPGSNLPEQKMSFQVRRSSFPYNGYYGSYYGNPYMRQYFHDVMNTKLKDISSRKREIHASNSNHSNNKHKKNETKRTFVPHKESTNTNEILPVEIKSAIATHSSPLQLRINSPNAKLRGIVPHVPEYGETVQSVRKVQKEIDWKRNFIPYPQQQSYAWTPPFFKMAPQTMYSNEIYKRNSIPHPPAPEHRNRISKRSKGTKTSKKSNKKTNKKKNAKKQKSTKKSNIDNSNKRQFIAQQPQPYMYPQYNTYLPTFDQNPYALQQNILQQPYLNTFQQQQAVTSQVRNMDGMETKPLVSSEPCSDQYISCTDFAKNNYCTNYPELMKIQCRKSCRYCIPTTLDTTNMENKTTDSQLPSTDSLMQFAANKTAATSLDNENAQNKNTTVTIADNDSSDGSGSGDSDSGSGSGSDADDDKVDTYIAPVPQKKSAVKKISNVKEKVKTNKKNSTIQSHEKLDIALKRESTPKSNSTLVTVKKVKSPQNKTKTFVQHKTDASSGSGMSEGSGESQSGSGSSDNNKIVTTKKSNIKMVLPTKEERNKIWQPKESPTHNLGEFSLPVKKNIIPMPSLNIVSMKTGSDDVSDSSGSGSGESGDESGSEATHDVTSTKKNVVVADNQQQSKEKKKSLPKVAADTPNVAPSKKSSNKINTDKQKAKKVYSVPKKEQQLSIKPQRRPKEKSTTNKTSNINVDKTKSVKKVKTKTNQPAKQVKQKKSSNKSNRREKKSKKKNKSKKKINNNKVKKMKIPLPPALGSAYPRIDLKSIASALAHYEEAAMELAGEYPNPSGNIDITEYQRSMIPHPSTRQIGSMDRYRQNIQIAKILQSERSKKDNIPEYLKVSSDAKKAESESDSIDADNLDLVRQRFNVPGVEPTLNDYYAETGKLNPFEKKKRKVKKSRIEVEKRMKKWNSFQRDPYEYLRNMPPGASMEPIEDPKARSAIPPDHSFPVILMKVSPGENKYVSEDASKRGKIRKLDAEGLPIEDNQQKPSPPATAPAESRHSVPEIPPPQQPVPYYPLPPQPLQSPFENMPGQQQAAGFPYPPSAFIERNSAPQVNEAFAQQPAVNMEQAPNHLRSKMLSAFFSIKNAIPMEEGSGGGEAVSRDRGTGSRQNIWPGGFKK